MAVEAMAVAKEVARDWVVVEVEMAEEAVEVAKAEEAEKADAASVLSREGMAVATVGMEVAMAGVVTGEVVEEARLVVEQDEGRVGVGRGD